MSVSDSQNTRPLLTAALSGGRLGLISDYDGTLSPFANDPAAARITPRNHRLLAELAAELPLVAIVTGRSAGDVAGWLDLPEIVYVGNHGFERYRNGQMVLDPAVRGYVDNIQAACEDLSGKLAPGEVLENKRITASVHYRNTADPAAARERLAPLLQKIAAEHGLVLGNGRMIFELLPPADFNKGTAVRDLAAEYSLDAVLFLGDDLTDVSGLQAVRDLRKNGLRGAAIGVDAPGTPAAVLQAADYAVPGVPGVEELLAEVLSARRASST